MDYEIKYSSRKTAAIQIKPEGIVLVRVPGTYSRQMVQQLVEAHSSWIEKKLSEQKQLEDKRSKSVLTEEERLLGIQKAKEIFPGRAAYYAERMSVDYGKITIKEQKTRWGSCSAAGNLNFNWKLVLAPETVLDYVVVHELAHRRFMNHSKEFYAFIGETLPDYKQSQLWLRKYGRFII